MDCLEQECEGKLVENPVFPTECGGSPAHPCNECGRLYWEDGSPAITRAGDALFLKEGKIVISQNGTFIPWA